jgi:hypothetical protein
MLPRRCDGRLAVREAAREGSSQSHQPMDRADVLTREAEVTIATLRGTCGGRPTGCSAAVVRAEAADGRLPHEGIPPDHFGETGRDGSSCGLDQMLCSAILMDDRHDRRVTVLGRARRHPDRPSRRCFHYMESERHRSSPADPASSLRTQPARPVRAIVPYTGPGRRQVEAPRSRLERQPPARGPARGRRGRSLTATAPRTTAKRPNGRI